MSEAKHTPGPWKLEGDLEPYISAEDGRTTIAYLPYAYETTGWTDQNQADAELITAAPDLLSALEFARDVVKGIKGLQISHGFWDYIDAAIAKARGAS